VIEFLFKLLLSALFALIIKGGVALFDHSIAWWLAAVLALALVFGFWLVFIDGDGAFD
jgi:hypothetical protein